ncbi:MAG: sugar phosphate isomerase/epimerase family protein [Desulfatibacillaceae bacterium]
MRIRLSVNTGFCATAFPRPETWVPLVRETLGVDLVQITADQFAPYMASDLARRVANRTRKVADDHGVHITSAFTGQKTRLSHFCHPVKEVRDFSLAWWCAFMDVAALCGAKAVGGPVGAMPLPDARDPGKRAAALETAVGYWRRVAEHAADAGVETVLWEPMSVAREFGHTLEDLGRVQETFTDFSVPMRPVLDVDHGDISSEDPADTDPYAYLAMYGKIAPIVHMKQALPDKSHHHPFTPEYNAKGVVEPGKVRDTLEQAGARDVEWCLELTFRERTPDEARMLDDLKSSLEYLRPWAE